MLGRYRPHSIPGVVPVSGPTRREALAGLATAAALGAMPAAALGHSLTDRSTWDAAMREYVAAKASADATRKRWHAAADTYKGLTGHLPWAIGHDEDKAVSRLTGFAQLEHVIDDVAERECDAAARLVKMPAPDGEALLWKLEHLFGEVERDDGGYGASYCGEWMDAIMSDARRLLITGRA